VDLPATRSGPALVLVVDDEPTLRVVLCRFLKAWGYRAAEAGDGVAALQMARELQQELRLIVTDIDMPRCNGLALAEQLLALDASLPILFITGVGSPEVYARAKPLGEVLEKPFTPAAFDAAVRRALSAGRVRREPA